MNPLTCDVCGGALTMQAGGTTAVCSVCGMQYSVERLREKVGAKRPAKPSTDTRQWRIERGQSGISRTAKPSTDTKQWRDLVRKYYAAGDFRGAEALVKKILEQAPSDTQANRWYEELQDLKYMDVRNGVLVKYTGSSKHVHIPNCITQIGAKAFEYNQLLTTVVIPDSVAVIGDYAFCGCHSLTSVVIPDGVTKIGDGAFYGCKSLASVVIPNSVTEIGNMAFVKCDNITSLQIRKELIRWEIFENISDKPIKWYEDYRRECDKQKERLSKTWKRQGRCIYCGGELTGLFTKKCRKCGRMQ